MSDSQWRPGTPWCVRSTSPAVAATDASEPSTCSSRPSTIDAIASALGADAADADAAADAADREALAEIGVDVAAYEPLVHAVGTPRPRFTAGGKVVMKRTLEYAVAERSRRMELRHLVLALLDRPEPDPAAALLSRLGVDATRARSALQRR